MRPRALWVTITKATIEVAVMVVFLVGVLNWTTVRDHLQAWLFQLTRETTTIDPEPMLRGADVDGPECLHQFANGSGWPVIFAPGRETGARELGAYPIVFRERMMTDEARALLEENGWRVLEQRFPHRAYVVILDNR